jgi:hypothetical protein
MLRGQACIFTICLLVRNQHVAQSCCHRQASYSCAQTVCLELFLREHSRKKQSTDTCKLYLHPHHICPWTVD